LEGGVHLKKKIVDYRGYLTEIMKAFDENRVLLVSQGNEGPPNAMAIGWGTVGLIWSKPIFLVLVRPSRHTYKLIEETGEFTVNIVPEGLKEVVAYCGTATGREHNKLQEKQLTVIPSIKVKPPIIQEAILHFECRVVNRNDLAPSELAKPIIPALYPKGDFHRLYFGEILSCRT